MPQEIRVLQCIQCEMFQADIVKKANKWQCKMCNAKQSLRKEIFRGSGIECRQKVQRLNREKSEGIEQKSNAYLDRLADEEDENILLEAAAQIDGNMTNHQRIFFESALPGKYILENENMSTNLTHLKSQGKRKQNSPNRDETVILKKKNKWEAFL